jgi:hypothetical protein
VRPFILKPHLSRNCQETSLRPDLERCSILGGGGGGFVAAVVAIRCAHPSQTRGEASLPLENANSWTGTPLCSHV